MRTLGDLHEIYGAMQVTFRVVPHVHFWWQQVYHD